MYFGDFSQEHGHEHTDGAASSKTPPVGSPSKVEDTEAAVGEEDADKKGIRR